MGLREFVGLRDCEEEVEKVEDALPLPDAAALRLGEVVVLAQADALRDCVGLRVRDTEAV